NLLCPPWHLACSAQMPFPSPQVAPASILPITPPAVASTAVRPAIPQGWPQRARGQAPTRSASGRPGSPFAGRVSKLILRRRFRLAVRPTIVVLGPQSNLSGVRTSCPPREVEQVHGHYRLCDHHACSICLQRLESLAARVSRSVAKRNEIPLHPGRL